MTVGGYQNLFGTVPTMSPATTRGTLVHGRLRGNDMLELTNVLAFIVSK